MRLRPPVIEAPDTGYLATAPQSRTEELGVPSAPCIDILITLSASVK